MAIYIFYCEKCNSNIEIKQSMEEELLAPRCPICETSKYVCRNYQAENVSISEGIKTVGSLADRNAAKFSEDKKIAISSKYKKPKDERPSEFDVPKYDPNKR